MSRVVSMVSMEVKGSRVINVLDVLDSLLVE